MNVAGIGRGAAAGGAGPPIQRTHGAGKVHQQTATGAAEGEQATVGAGEKTKGVVRLLQEGHFKGVADVRLRINFADELAAIEHDGLAGIVEEAVPGLLDAVNAQVDGLVASGELSEEQAATVAEAQVAFNAAVQQLAQDLVAGGGTNTGALTAGIQSAFDTLAEALEPLLGALNAPEEEASAEVLPAVEEVPTEEPAQTSILLTFMEDLSGAFSAALEEMQGALDNADILPPLSGPSGNGVAYAKFLAVYNELHGIGGTETSSPEAEPIDLIT